MAASSRLLGNPTYQTFAPHPTFESSRWRDRRFYGNVEISELSLIFGFDPLCFSSRLLSNASPCLSVVFSRPSSEIPPRKGAASGDKRSRRQAVKNCRFSTMEPWVNSKIVTTSCDLISGEFKDISPRNLADCTLRTEIDMDDSPYKEDRVPPSMEKRRTPGWR